MENEVKIESKLGFDKLRDSVSRNCSTLYAKEMASEEKISVVAEEVSRRLVLVDEFRQIMMFEPSFPDSPFVDCIPFLIPLKSEYAYIDLASLARLRDALDLLRRILSFFSNCKEEKYPNLKKLSAPVISFPEVSRRIDTILDKYGNVRDNASEELYAIRRSIREKEGIASRRIQAILKKAQQDGIADSEAQVSVRDGKLLIPVSSGNKRKVPGLVYDESSSGKTSFVEPLEVVEINNQVRELHFEEQREIIRILTQFTEFLRPYIDDIVESGEFMGLLDFIRAKAIVCARFQGGMPILSVNGEVILKKARHPLLEEALKKEGKAIVPLDITLTSEKRILLISGPNAGGKSVCLKTVGLLQYMMQWGLLIPAAESSELSIFKGFFVDIGDDQSLENDLSTYSSHLMNMKEVVEGADSKSLVLIDEFGSGTEPAAGGAIAEQLLYELEQRGCYGMITTHYTNLKFFANNSNRIVNGAMMFDVQKIMPMFKLEIGLPGNSFAFELARKIGLPEYIVKGAEERAGNDYVSIERNLRKIARNKRQLEEKLTRIKATDKTLDNITEKYEKELTEIKSLRKSIIEEAKREAQEILSSANKKIENTIREIKESQAEKARTALVRKELKDFTESLEDTQNKSQTDAKIERKMAQIIERKKRQQERKAKRASEAAAVSADGGAPKVVEVEIPEVKVGSYVRVEGSELVGEVLSISGKKASVAVGDIISKIELAKLTPITSNKFKNIAKPTPVAQKISASISDRKLNFKPSIDIRGMKLEEAIMTVTHFIDDAMMVGVGEVSILHGKGNGVLKEEIRKYLKITPGVVSFADEHVERGGSGITIVKL